MGEPIYYDTSGRPYTVRHGESVWLPEPVYRDSAGRPYTVRNGVSVWLDPAPSGADALPEGPADSETYLFGIVEGIQARELAEGFASLTPAEQVFIGVWWLEAEVNNGGFEQYYDNSSGDIAYLAPSHLRSIGAEHTAVIVEQAGRAFGPEGPPADRVTRQLILEGFGDDVLECWGELDSAFLAYEDNLSDLLAAYMRANRADPA